MVAHDRQDKAGVHNALPHDSWPSFTATFPKSVSPFNSYKSMQSLQLWQLVLPRYVKEFPQSHPYTYRRRLQYDDPREVWQITASDSEKLTGIEADRVPSSILSWKITNCIPSQHPEPPPIEKVKWKAKINYLLKPCQTPTQSSQNISISIIGYQDLNVSRGIYTLLWSWFIDPRTQTMARGHPNVAHHPSSDGQPGWKGWHQALLNHTIINNIIS